MRKKQNILTILIIILVFTFVLGVLGYVGGALLQFWQPINFAQIFEPQTALKAGLSLVVSAVIGWLITHNKYHRKR